MAPLNFCNPEEDPLDDPYERLTCQPLPPHRVFWYHSDLADQQYVDPDEVVRRPSNAYDANLISSLTKNGMHAPALDIDFECQLVPSRTLGHYHLYLSRTMPWWQYRILLKVLAWAGIIEPGYYRASVARKQTFLRWNIDDWLGQFGETDVQIAQLKEIARMTSG